MRISFDIDDTLVCPGDTPQEQHVPWLWQWWYPELLRQGTRQLLRELQTQRHSLCLYTTSYRPCRYLRGWFRSLGIRLAEAINQERHEQVIGVRGPSKYPPAFGIDLHIDDSEGVAEEGRRHHFRVLVVRPDDPDWTARVLAEVRGCGHSG